MNPPIYSPGSWDYHAVNITIGEYISKVEINVCNHKNSDRICYLNFHSNFGKSIPWNVVLGRGYRYYQKW